MKIAILGGTGDQGFGLALRLAKNHKIIIGSRKKEKAEQASEKAKEILKKRGINAEILGLENKDAAKEGDVVILSLPYEYTLSTIKQLKDELKGKIVVSIGVPLATAIGDKPTRLLFPPDGSVAEMIQNVLKESKVVSAFQNICHAVLEDLDNPVDCDVLICGDNEEAKKVVIDLANQIDGVRAIDCGNLEKSRIVEAITPLLIGLNIKYKSKGTGIRITNLNM
ncbi:NADPH-dependent F420 reductase [Methanocaldococcus vulcanius M7]|uniref:NADPH-dependent F420 reductase n=1 Tax=Methanocaldococcus vulcanius (strain ATCC 700851 / DSM 12094 / M7) TaxID=579137 RepID=C9RGR2_METVM|nr:NADPH-dependent F420 reductase [Methanocaldococcus vulcanius]ACX72764.1 NADPH-dependent F420 reductase [Methanocaldococcus vulcanius M7]